MTQSQLQIKALAVHPHGDVADAGPGIEPGDRRHEESATLVEHGGDATSDGDAASTPPIRDPVPPSPKRASPLDQTGWARSTIVS